MPIIINDVPVDCINYAAIVYSVPATVILSVMKKENGRNGIANKNKNGTFDYGVMQINSIWLPKITNYGYSKEDIQYNACKNIFVGTWILSQSIAGSENLWTGVANYHSRTPIHHYPYKKSVYKSHYKLISAMLS
jgi:soluble lytic murein transglycosylase-like protein